MGIEDVLFQHIVTNFTYNGTIYLDSAEGASGQYLTMFKIDDPESRVVLCDEPGGEGQALIRFVGVQDYEIAADGATVRAYTKTLKDQVNLVKGVIGTTTQYRIWSNETTGVITIGDGKNELNTWSAYFDSLLWWTLI